MEQVEMTEEPYEIENEVLEPTLDIEPSPMMEPSQVLACELPAMGVQPHHYWQAQNFASALHHEFERLNALGDKAAMRQNFYILGRYYGRTMAILRSALKYGREELINTALRNLIALHQPLHHMHDIAKTSVPFALTLDKNLRRRLIEDLIMEVLGETQEPLEITAIAQRVNDINLLAYAKEEVIKEHLRNLISQGYVQEEMPSTYTVTKRRYKTINLDRNGLKALLGEELYYEFANSGFQGLSSLINRRQDFKKFFERFTGCGHHMAELFITTSIEILGPPTHASELSPWHFANLIDSLNPRPYQYEAYAIFRGYGYQGQVIEAPTGSGKTMIGMMCLQDWLRTMSLGETVLILVPTVNYQQQWVEELSYKPIGLQMSANDIFAGTPTGFKNEQQNTGRSPAVMVLTYTALAKLVSEKDIEAFIEQSNVQYVILDEVHKVADDLNSASAQLTQLLIRQLGDGHIRGLIGFSGTAASYRSQFASLGLQLVYAMPAADLIAYGFVAPFTELGIPFAYSDREKRVLELLSQYKDQVKRFIGVLGASQLRRWLSQIPPQKKLDICRDWLNMYEGYNNRDEAILKRIKGWEADVELSLNDLPLISTIQLGGALSDIDLCNMMLTETPVEEQVKKRGEFEDIMGQARAICTKLREIIFLPDIRDRLAPDNLGTQLIIDWIEQSKDMSKVAIEQRIKDSLATTLTGLYMSLREFYYRVGEGRVDSIKSVIEAERAARRVPALIIFDNGKRISWQKSKVTPPGFAGVAGLFTEMLGDHRFNVMAVISDEIYISCSEECDLADQIASFIKSDLMVLELGEAMFNIISHGVALSVDKLKKLNDTFQAIHNGYVESLDEVGGKRPREFNRKVLAKFRRSLKKFRLGNEIIDVLRSRASIKNHHIDRLADDFYNYCLIYNRFKRAVKVYVRQASGNERPFYVVRMASGERKLLMYDLTSRILDAEKLPINIIVVSLWARTGWNVISPNILIDATATRDVTAWKQLRGRAMRASPSWCHECSLLMMRLLGSHMKEVDAIKETFLADILSKEELQSKLSGLRLADEKARDLLLDVLKNTHKRSLRRIFTYDIEDSILSKIQNAQFDELTESEKKSLAAILMLARNKVTHIYELIKAYGSVPQIYFQRSAKEWHRLNSISLKHNQEYSVNPFSGQLEAGEKHAPLIYHGNPKDNSPVDLNRLLTRELNGLDIRVVNGWISAVTAEHEG